MATSLTQLNIPYPSFNSGSSGGGSGLGALNNLTSLLGPIAQVGAGFAGVSGGVGHILAGGDLQAGTLRQAGETATITANYNIQLEKLNLARSLDNLSRQAGRSMAAQRVASVNNSGGISKSSLMVMHSNLAQFERQILRERENSKFKQDAMLFDAQLTETQYENQARAAEYQSEVAAYNVKVQQAQAIGGAISSVGGGIGQAFGGFF